jgi:O-antigen/teichoic acid export membrane protein
MGILYPIVTLAYVARILGPVSLGKYYFANALAAYFVFAAGLGIPVYGNREVSRVRGNESALRKTFTELFFINAVSTLFFATLYVATVFIVPDFRAEYPLFLVFGLMILNNAITIDFFYAGLERQGHLAYRSLVSKIIAVALIFALIKSPGDYVWFAGIAFVTVFVNSALAFGGLKYWGGMALVGWRDLRRHVRPVILIAVSMVFINVYMNLDSVILGLMANPHEVGLYNAAIRPCRLISVLLASMMGVALPRLSYYLANGSGHDLQHALKKKSLEMLLMIAIPIAVTFAFCAPHIIDLLYGKEFSEASGSLVLASPLIVLNCLATFHVFQIVIPLGKESFLVYAAAVGAIVSVALNVVLIPLMGYHGSIFAALATEVATVGVQIALLRGAGKGLLVFPTGIWRHLLAAAVLFSVQWFGLRGEGESLARLVVVWGISSGCYVGTLWLLREPLVRDVTSRLPFFRRA